MWHWNPWLRNMFFRMLNFNFTANNPLVRSTKKLMRNVLYRPTVTSSWNRATVISNTGVMWMQTFF